MGKDIFPQVKRSIQDFLYEEEGNIPRNKMLTVGTMVLLMSILFASDAFAAHRSHSSHRSGSHSSHGSHNSHSNATPRPTATPVPVPVLESMPTLQTPQANTYSVPTQQAGVTAAAALPAKGK